MNFNTLVPPRQKQLIFTGRMYCSVQPVVGACDIHGGQYESICIRTKRDKKILWIRIGPKGGWTFLLLKERCMLWWAEMVPVNLRS